MILSVLNIIRFRDPVVRSTCITLRRIFTLFLVVAFPRGFVNPADQHSEGLRDAISNTQHRCVIYDSTFIKELISPGPGGYSRVQRNYGNPTKQRYLFRLVLSD